jgi:hypothetical protein
LGTADAAAPTYKVDYRGIQYVESVADMYSRGYIFHLIAKSRKTGLPIAQASCATLQNAAAAGEFAAAGV